MSQSNNDIDRVRAMLERFKLSNTDLRQQLSDSLARSQRLASSLGFRDIYEAQATIDAADQDLSYRQCLEELERFKAQRDSAPERVRELEEQSRASDIAADVLPFALRLAHCEVSGLRQSDVDDLPAEGTIKMYEIIGQGRETLQRNAKTVREWEDMFSFHQKDRKSKASRLTLVESFRFQRALYRIMLVCWLYGMDSIPASDMQDERYPHAFYKIYQARQIKFLRVFPIDDRYEINRVVAFLDYIASCVMMRDSDIVSTLNVFNWVDLHLFAGPKFIMNQYQDREQDSDNDIPFRNLCRYLGDDGPYNDFLNSSLIVARTDGPRFHKRILDSVEGAQDLCIRCHCPRMDRVYFLRNESSWDFMKFSDILVGVTDEVSRIRSTMELQYPLETELLFNEIKKIFSKQLMEEIFELRQAEYTSWNREDWACIECWKSLLADTFPIWWAKRRPQQMDGKDEV